MDYGRVSWLTVIGACAVAVVLLAINGYTGYSITVAAVGLAAAVNLLPERHDVLDPPQP